MIEQGWIEWADKRACLLAMASRHNHTWVYKAIVSILHFEEIQDHELMSKFMLEHPALVQYIPLQSIPESEYTTMLTQMSLFMRKGMWSLCVRIINTNIVPAEEVYEFIRRAVHVVDTKQLVRFLVDSSDSAHYDFFRKGMLYYLAPSLCAYFSSDVAALYGLTQLEMLRRSPIIIEEMLARFRSAFPDLAGDALYNASSLLYSLDFRYLTRMPTNLRFFALKLPIVCIEKTPFFNRDDEVICLAMQCEDIYTMSTSCIHGIDVEYIASTLFSTIVKLNGGWGALSFISTRNLVQQRACKALRYKLFRYLLDDANLRNVYKHLNGHVYLHQVRLTSHHHLPWIEVIDAPVNIHPVDICGANVSILGYVDKVLSTNANNLPPRVEFYFNQLGGAQSHADQVKKTMLTLVSILSGVKGVTSCPLVYANNDPVLFHGEGVTHLLCPGDAVDYQLVNRIVEVKMGVSLLSVFAGDRFIINGWAWFGFAVHPLFQWMSMHFVQFGLGLHPRNIVQVSCHVQTPDIRAPQSTQMSPWVVYDPYNLHTRGPRLMRQDGLHTRVFSVFDSEFVGSGNQLMVALQHFTNAKNLRSSIMRFTLDMEMHWARAITHHKHAENNRMFNESIGPDVWIPSFIQAKARQSSGASFTLTCPVFAEACEAIGACEASESCRGQAIIRMLPKLPQDVIVKIYRMLWSSGRLRNAIPDIWWSTPKQLLYYCGVGCLFDSCLYMKTSVAGLTDEHGVLLLPYQTEILSFFREISFSVVCFYYYCFYLAKC